MNFNLNLNPDDVLIIDTEIGEVTHNGQEVFTYSGSLFSISPNTSTITYDDSGTSRNLELAVEHTERYE